MSRDGSSEKAVCGKSKRAQTSRVRHRSTTGLDLDATVIGFSILARVRQDGTICNPARLCRDHKRKEHPSPVGTAYLNSLIRQRSHRLSDVCAVPFGDSFCHIALASRDSRPGLQIVTSLSGLIAESSTQNASFKAN